MMMLISFSCSLNSKQLQLSWGEQNLLHTLRVRQPFWMYSHVVYENRTQIPISRLSTFIWLNHWNEMKSSSLPRKNTHIITNRIPRIKKNEKYSLTAGVACSRSARSARWSKSESQSDNESESEFQRKSVECAKCEVSSKDALHASHCATRYSQWTSITQLYICLVCAMNVPCTSKTSKYIYSIYTRIYKCMYTRMRKILDWNALEP